mgnify:CR=1 FL=1
MRVLYTSGRRNLYNPVGTRQRACGDFCRQQSDDGIASMLHRLQLPTRTQTTIFASAMQTIKPTETNHLSHVSHLSHVNCCNILIVRVLCQKADLQDNNAFALSGRNNVTIYYPGRCPGLTATLRLQRAVV